MSDFTSNWLGCCYSGWFKYRVQGSRSDASSLNDSIEESQCVEEQKTKGASSDQVTSEQVEMDNVTQQKIMETIINIRRKNRRPDTDTIYKELTKECASNVNSDDIGNQIKLMIDNGILENRPSN